MNITKELVEKSKGDPKLLMELLQAQQNSTGNAPQMHDRPESGAQPEPTSTNLTDADLEAMSINDFRSGGRQIGRWKTRPFSAFILKSVDDAQKAELSELDTICLLIWLLVEPDKDLILDAYESGDFLRHVNRLSMEMTDEELQMFTQYITRYYQLLGKLKSQTADIKKNNA